MSAIQADVNTDSVARDTSRATSVQVWDLPLRIFHWSLVIAIAAAYVTGEFGGGEWAHWHGRIGWAVLGLLLFRVVWGFIGSRHARFVSFLPTPSRVASYIRGEWRGAGHNPLGALSVIALLTLLAAQVSTGLFADDDIAFAGPLSSWVDKSTSERLTGWHEQIFYVLAGFIVLHIVAILFYQLVRRTPLIVPMITGNKPLSSVQQTPTERPLTWRFLVAVLLAATVSGLIFRTPQAVPAEEVAPPAATTDW